MSLAYINDLPTELLRQVFKYLFREERGIAATVCTCWSDIISRGRYSDNLESIYCLAEEDDSVLQHCRSISTQYVYGPDRDTVIRMQQFLNNKVVMRNIEELYIAFRDYFWTDVFSLGKELHFPELRRITFEGLSYDDAMIISHSKFIAPRLKVLKLISSPLTWLKSNQIHTLVIENCKSLVMPDAKLLTKLRSLTLKNIDEVPVNDSFKTVVRQLKVLKILDMDNLNLRELFSNIRNIESLSISGVLQMSAKIYALINNMKKLKELSLLISVDGCARGLSLPCLEKLTIPVIGWPPLETVPNLRSLSIQSNCSSTELVGCEKQAAYFRLFGHQLHHLTLSYLSLANDFVDQICSFRNLQTIKMLEVEMEFAYIGRIFPTLSNLRLFRLEYCLVAELRAMCYTMDDCGCKQCTRSSYHKESEASQVSIEAYFSALRAQYVDCAIVTDSNYCTEQALIYV